MTDQPASFVRGSGRASDYTAVIPAAGPVPPGVLTLSTLTSPAMVPVGGRPVIHWTIDYLFSLGIERFRIGVPERGLFVESYLEAIFGSDVALTFVVPSASRGPGFTVCELVDGVDTPASLVVLGDTFFRFDDPDCLTTTEPVVLVSTVDESYRWCVAESSKSGLLVTLHDKVSGLDGPLNALIGAYVFPSVAVLRKAAARAVAHADDGPVSIAEILTEVGKESSVHVVPAASWIDCGNPDRQADAQRLLLQEREFNQLSVDSTYGTITKRSRNVEKFVDEINYIRLLPKELEVLFPRVLEFKLDWDEPSATMEFYGYPTLAELFVFENVDPSIWRRIFGRLHTIVDEGFGTFKRPLAPQDSIDMLFGKVVKRRELVRDSPVLNSLLFERGTILLNGIEVRTLGSLEVELANETQRLAESPRGSIIHGDLCFSNILYDPRSGVFKLIDPRGSYGRAGIYGDLRYDVAKLCHSVVGLYDFITADLFKVDFDHGHATLDIRSRSDHERIRGHFEKIFYETFDKRDILLMTGIIFLGLPALHADAPERQKAFCLRGLQLVHEALEMPVGARQ